MLHILRVKKNSDWQIKFSSWGTYKGNNTKQKQTRRRTVILDFLWNLYLLEMSPTKLPNVIIISIIMQQTKEMCGGTDIKSVRDKEDIPHCPV